MTPAVGVALIGTGTWGRRMAGAMRRTSALRLVSCFSRQAENREAFARELDRKSVV